MKEAHFVFAAPPDHPLANQKNLSITEIAEHDVIIMNKQFSFSELSTEETKHLRQEIEPIFDIWNPIGAMELAKCGVGITLLPDYLITDAVQKKELCILDVPDLDFSFWIQTVCHHSKTVTPQMDAFFKLIKEYYHIDG